MHNVCNFFFKKYPIKWRKKENKNGVSNENYHHLIYNNATIIKQPGTCGKKKLKGRLMVQNRKQRNRFIL